MFDTESYLLGLATGGGGGNPNHLEVISGTLANPWGAVDFVVLAKEFLQFNSSVMLRIVVGSNDIVLPGMFIDDGSGYTAIFGTLTSDPDNPQGVCVQYSEGEAKAAFQFRGLNGSYDTHTLESNTPSSLIIIHHPLP